MAEEQQPEEVETVRYYTRARKFPQLLGRMPDGTKIPGGPYTVQQLLAGIAVLVLGAMTMDMWGIFGAIGNIIALFGITYAAIFVVGRIPLNGRNPFFAVAGIFRVVNAPATGRFQGKPMRFRRPRTMHHMTNVYVGTLPGVDPFAGMEPGVSLADIAAPDSLRRRLVDHPGLAADTTGERPEVDTPETGPLTGVQALLALIPADNGHKRDSDPRTRPGVR